MDIHSPFVKMAEGIESADHTVNNLAKELMSLVSEYPYTDNVLKINPSDIIVPQAWSMMGLATDYWKDTSYCYTDCNLTLSEPSLFLSFSSSSDFVFLQY